MRNLFSTILLIVLIPLTLLFICASAMKLSIATPSFIKDEIVRRDVYTIAQKQLIEQTKSLIVASTTPVTSLDVEHFITDVFPTTWLKQNTEQTIDRAFAWLESPPHDPLSLPIDTTQPKKQALITIDVLLEQKIKDDLLRRNIPEFLPCTADAPKDSEACLLLQLNVKKLKQGILEKMPDPALFAAKIPDTIDLMNPAISDLSFGNATGTLPDIAAATIRYEQNQAKAGTIKFQYQQITRYYFLFLVVYVLLLLSYIFLNMHHARRSVFSASLLFLLAGLSSAFAAVAGRNIFETKLLPKISFAETSMEIQRLVLNIIGDVEYTFFTIILVTGIILTMLGVVGVICLRFTKK